MIRELSKEYVQTHNNPKQGRKPKLCICGHGLSDHRHTKERECDWSNCVCEKFQVIL